MMWKWRNFGKEESGSMALVAALGMVALLGMAALTVDVGHLQAVKNELQRAADAGALAGARALWPTTLPIVNTPPNPDWNAAKSVALSVSTSSNNIVDGAALPQEQVTVKTGRWDYSSRTFSPGTGANTNAVQVVTQTTGTTFFAKVLGVSQVKLSAVSIAVMDFASGVGKGGLPIAISRNSVVPGQAVYVNFTPDQVDTGGWFADPPSAASAWTFRDYINNADCPPLNTGDLINLQNGNDTSVLQALKDKLDQNGGTWDTVLPVVDATQFVGSQPITGFVGFRITEVDATGDHKGVTGTVLGLYESSSAQPGGSDFGVLAPPKTVF